MSNEAITWAFKRDELPPLLKLVLLCLADHADPQTCQCFPSIAYMAKRCSMSPKSVQRHLRRLEIRGLIKATERTGKSSVYTLIYDPGQIVTGVASTPVKPEPPHPGHRRPPTPVTVDRQNPHLTQKGKNIKRSEGEAGKGGKQAGGQPKRKPRHGQRTKDGLRIWFDYRTPDWIAYAENYAAKHSGMSPGTQWAGTGTWFNYLGE